MEGFEPLWAGMQDFFQRGHPFSADNQDTLAQEKKGYAMRSSFTQMLPYLWAQSYKERNFILLEDGKSVGAALNVMTVSTEAKEEEFLVGVRDAIQRLFSTAMEEHQESPWVIQLYGYRDESVTKHYLHTVKRYAQSCLKDRYDELPAYSRYYFDEVLGPHLQDLSQADGLFKDPLTGSSWSGCQRQVVVCLYRRHGAKATLKRGQDRLMELDEQVTKVQSSLASAGLVSSVMTGQAFYEWLFRWFNPSPPSTQGDTERFLGQCPYPASEEYPADWTLADAVCTPDITSDKVTGFWTFDGQPHTVLTAQRLTGAPAIGQISGERVVGDQKVAMLDKLPPGSTFVISLVISGQNLINNHLDRLEKASKSQTAEALLTQENIAKARHNIVRQNKVYPYQVAVYLKADTEEALELMQTQVAAHLQMNHLQVIPGEYDDLQLDAYLRHLPMAYKPDLDQCRIRRGLIYAQHAANLVPIYGRGRGTGHPGMLFYNRGGEVFTADPLNLADRSKNGHMFLFGPTGSSKSATLNYLQMHVMAVYRPRIIAIEAGNSFGLLSQHFAAKGLKVRDIILRPGCGTSLPPFNLALQLVDSQGEPLALSAAGTNTETARDILGELTLIATMMVTGGDVAVKLSRPQQGLLEESILRAAGEAVRQGKDQLLTGDVIDALAAFLNKRPEDAASLHFMIDSMRMFTRGFAGELFNRPGQGFEDDVDYLRVELGSLAGDGQFDKLAVAYIGIINAVLAMAERHQRDGRPTVLITDEAHIITTQPLLSSYLVLYIKLLGRRLGLWFWMATQNMADFTGDARKMLDMFEWWMCLKMGKTEMAQLEAFKDLQPEQRAMMLDTRKEAGKYAEGVMLSDKVQGLFRNVPPALPMALAMTEKEEKTERQQLMEAYDIDELAAAYRVADILAQGRRKKDTEREEAG